MPSTEETISFIRATFTSSWSLELLRILMQERQQTLSHGAMVSALRGSDLIVQQSVRALAAGGLILPDGDGAARYAPVNSDIAELAEAAISMYATSPITVRRLILSAANPSVTAFAEAFRLRRTD